jgi:hypothetical protein
MEPTISAVIVVETGKKVNYRLTLDTNMPPFKGMEYKFDDFCLTVDHMVVDVEGSDNNSAETGDVWIYVKKPKHVTVAELVRKGFEKFNY